ncbi:MAG: NADH-quinone oxidoreductase subunit NuoE [Paracoccaceae bacterium]
MLRRLHPHQPASFAFTDANRAWAEAQITKYPDGRQASAIIPLLWRAQEQEGWLTRPAIEHVAAMLDMAYIRALEVATFYFMFHLHPVGTVAHVQVCGTTSCMICGAEDLVDLCKARISPEPHVPSADGRFSWEEVECLGACANAPMAQIGKDYFEDLTPASLGALLDELSAGRVPRPGSQSGRFASEPSSGATTLTDGAERFDDGNASVALALGIGDTVKRIDGTEVPLRTPWIADGVDDGTPPPVRSPEPELTPGAQPTADRAADETGISKQSVPADSAAKPKGPTNPDGDEEASVGPRAEIDATPVDADADADGEGDAPHQGAPDTERARETGAAKGGGPAARPMMPETAPAPDADTSDDATGAARARQAAGEDPRDARDGPGRAASAEFSDKAEAAAAGTRTDAGDRSGPEGDTADAESAPDPAQAPISAAPDAAEAEPERLDAPQGTPDDLKRIKGVGPKLEGLLNEMGFWHFRQIADWGAEEIAWVDARLRFKGRIERDDWVAQAKALCADD